jgi:hypothetical protein
VEMRQAMDAITDGMPTYNAALAAVQLKDKLLQDDPDLLNGWLEEQSVFFLKEAFRARDASTRAHARKQAAPAAFSKDAKKFAAGSATAMDGWLQASFVSDDKETRKPLGDMTAEEVRYVAAHYDNRAKANALQAAFLLAVAKRTRTVVKDDFDNETLGTLWNSMNK